MKRHTLIVVLALSIIAWVSTSHSATLDVPNPAITVNPNYSNTTTIVTMGTTSFRGPSRFFYVGECQKPDSASYRCDVVEEDQVVLTAPSGQTMVVSLVVQSSAVLIRSGHNYWRHTDTVLSGTVSL